MNDTNIKSCGGIMAVNGCCSGKMIEVRQYTDTGLYFCQCSCGKNVTAEYSNPIEALIEFWKTTNEKEYQSTFDRIVQIRLQREKSKNTENNKRVIENLNGTIRLIQMQNPGMK